MHNASHRDSPHSDHAALIERVVMLRTALQGLTDDHAILHRRLLRARAENAALRARLESSGAPTFAEATAR